MTVNPIYLDYNGTTPHDPGVIEAIRPFLETEFGNPSSSHWYGIVPKKAVETARGQQVAKLLNCSPREIIFTSGGSLPGYCGKSNDYRQGPALSGRLDFCALSEKRRLPDLNIRFSMMTKMCVFQGAN